MRILLTNDDGYEAEGINVLAGVLGREHEVYVVAPSVNYSGASSSLHMMCSQRLVDHGKRGNAHFWSLEGSPVDCVLSALNAGYIPRADVVVSGINHGANLGTDVVYSGTCGGARQAALDGVPGIALSIPGERNFNFSALSEFALKNLDALVEFCGQKKTVEGKGFYEYFVNVNAPSASEYKGVRICSTCFRDYGDKVRVDNKADGMYSFCTGGDIVRSLGDESSDGIAVSGGYVAVSALHSGASFRNLDMVENRFIL